MMIPAQIIREAVGVSYIVYGLQDGTLCSNSGDLDEEHFEAAMRHQLRQYAGRRISDFLYHGCAGDADRAKAWPSRLSSPFHFV